MVTANPVITDDPNKWANGSAVSLVTAAGVTALSVSVVALFIFFPPASAFLGLTGTAFITSAASITFCIGLTLTVYKVNQLVRHLLDSVDKKGMKIIQDTQLISQSVQKLVQEIDKFLSEKNHNRELGQEIIGRADRVLKTWKPASQPDVELFLSLQQKFSELSIRLKAQEVKDEIDEFLQMKNHNRELGQEIIDRAYRVLKRCNSASLSSDTLIRSLDEKQRELISLFPPAQPESDAKKTADGIVKEIEATLLIKTNMFGLFEQPTEKEYINICRALIYKAKEAFYRLNCETSCMYSPNNQTLALLEKQIELLECRFRNLIK